MMMLFLSALVATSAPQPLLLSSNKGALKLSLDASTLAYTVHVSGAAWFDSSSSATGGYGAALSDGFAMVGDKSLVAVGAPQHTSGLSDATGMYDAITIRFARGNKTLENTEAEAAAAAAVIPEVEWTATFKAYTDRTALVFAQTWTKGVAKATGGSVFPSLHHVAKEELGTLEYTGASCGFMVRVVRVVRVLCSHCAIVPRADLCSSFRRCASLLFVLTCMLI